MARLGVRPALARSTENEDTDHAPVRTAASLGQGQASAPFEKALRSLRPGGTLSSLGVYSGKLQIPYDAFAAGLGDNRIVTTLCPGGKERMGRLIRMVQSGRFDPTPLITHHFSLGKIGEAYRIFSNRLDGVLKVAINPQSKGAV